MSYWYREEAWKAEEEFFKEMKEALLFANFSKNFQKTLDN